ncbi:unnamed protein product [Euphydryas editha]|uniref:Uncharacterized protein n=1 Tax=Euphydryas editha TaxID=104508 RepID=A0AAU9TR57_EUPED|nr:unnamed protein product [Euphydryas editha]
MHRCECESAHVLAAGRHAPASMCAHTSDSLARSHCPAHDSLALYTTTGRSPLPMHRCECESAHVLAAGRHAPASMCAHTSDSLARSHCPAHDSLALYTTTGRSPLPMHRCECESAHVLAAGRHAPASMCAHTSDSLARSHCPAHDSLALYTTTGRSPLPMHRCECESAHVLAAGRHAPASMCAHTSDSLARSHCPAHDSLALYTTTGRSPLPMHRCECESAHVLAAGRHAPASMCAHTSDSLARSHCPAHDSLALYTTTGRSPLPMHRCECESAHVLAAGRHAPASMCAHTSDSLARSHCPAHDSLALYTTTGRSPLPMHRCECESAHVLAAGRHAPASMCAHTSDSLARSHCPAHDSLALYTTTGRSPLPMHRCECESAHVLAAGRHAPASMCAHTSDSLARSHCPAHDSLALYTTTGRSPLPMHRCECESAHVLAAGRHAPASMCAHTSDSLARSHCPAHDSLALYTTTGRSPLPMHRCECESAHVLAAGRHAPASMCAHTSDSLARSHCPAHDSLALYTTTGRSPLPMHRCECESAHVLAAGRHAPASMCAHTSDSLARSHCPAHDSLALYTTTGRSPLPMHRCECESAHVLAAGRHAPASMCAHTSDSLARSHCPAHDSLALYTTTGRSPLPMHRCECESAHVLAAGRHAPASMCAHTSDSLARSHCPAHDSLALYTTTGRSPLPMHRCECESAHVLAAGRHAPASMCAHTSDSLARSHCPAHDSLALYTTTGRSPLPMHRCECESAHVLAAGRHAPASMCAHTSDSLARSHCPAHDSLALYTTTGRSPLPMHRCECESAHVLAAGRHAPASMCAHTSDSLARSHCPAHDSLALYTTTGRSPLPMHRCECESAHVLAAGRHAPASMCAHTSDSLARSHCPAHDSLALYTTTGRSPLPMHRCECESAHVLAAGRHAPASMCAHTSDSLARSHCPAHDSLALYTTTGRSPLPMHRCECESAHVLAAGRHAPASMCAHTSDSLARSHCPAHDSLALYTTTGRSPLPMHRCECESAHVLAAGRHAPASMCAHTSDSLARSHCPAHDSLAHATPPPLPPLLLLASPPPASCHRCCATSCCNKLAFCYSSRILPIHRFNVI